MGSIAKMRVSRHRGETSIIDFLSDELAFKVHLPTSHTPRTWSANAASISTQITSTIQAVRSSTGEPLSAACCFSSVDAGNDDGVSAFDFATTDDGAERGEGVDTGVELDLDINSDLRRLKLKIAIEDLFKVIHVVKVFTTIGFRFSHFANSNHIIDNFPNVACGTDA